MQTIGLTAVIVFYLGTPAMADEIVPAEYQGVWAAARDCTDNLQDVISDSVNPATCRLPRNAGRKLGRAGSALEHCLSELRGLAEPRNLARRKCRGRGLSYHSSVGTRRGGGKTVD